MRKIKGTALIIITLIFSYFYFININVNLTEFAPLLHAAFICVMAYLAYELFGFPKFGDTSIQITVIKGLVTIMVVYLASLYILGIFSGFEKNVFCLTTVITIISLIATEIFRYTIINSNRDSDLFPFVVTLTLIIFELSVALDVNAMLNPSTVIVYVATVITPIILKNLVLTLYCQHINIRIAYIYSIIVMSYRNIIPIVPNLNDFTYAYAEIMLSFLVLTMSYRIIIKNYEGYSMIGLKDGFTLLDFLLFFVFFSFGILISGASPIQMYVAKNDIKNTNLKEGDAPIILKTVNEFNISEKDIIFYENDSNETKLYVVSKVEEIKPIDAKEKPYRVIEVIDDNKIPITVDNKRIKGKVVYYIKYLFKPSLKVKKHLVGGAE